MPSRRLVVGSGYDVCVLPPNLLEFHWPYVTSFQFKDFLATYNQVTENCFLDCVNDFTSRRVTKEEVREGGREGGDEGEADIQML